MCQAPGPASLEPSHLFPIISANIRGTFRPTSPAHFGPHPRHTRATAHWLTRPHTPSNTDSQGHTRRQALAHKATHPVEQRLTRPHSPPNTDSQGHTPHRTLARETTTGHRTLDTQATRTQALRHSAFQHSGTQALGIPALRHSGTRHFSTQALMHSAFQ